MRALRTSLFLRLLVLSAMALAVAVAAVWVYARFDAERTAQRQADLRMQAAAHSLLAAFSVAEPGTAIADPAGAPLGAPSDFPEFEIYDAEGQAIARSAQFPAQLDSSAEGFSRQRGTAQSWRVYKLTDSRTGTTCRIAVSEAERTRATNDVVDVAYPILGIIPLGLLLGFLALWQGLRPLRAIEQALERQDPHHPRALDLDARALPRELQRLVATLNALLERLADVLGRQRVFAGAAAHELRTPLAAIQSQIDLATRAPEDAMRRTALGRASEQTQRLSHLVSRLLLLARSETGALRGGDQICDLCAVLDELETILEDQFDTVELCFERPAEEVRVHAEPVLVRTLLINLIENAVSVSPTNGRVVASLCQARGQARMRVSDEGPGIAPNDRVQVFAPFHSGVRRDGGAGLGLAIARNIARGYGGDIVIEDSMRGGAVFLVTLPVASD